MHLEPNTPVIMSIENGGHVDQLTVRWEHEGNVERFDIECQSTDGSSHTATAGASETNTDVTDLNAGFVYECTVTAFANGETSVSDSSEGKTSRNLFIMKCFCIIFKKMVSLIDAML